MLSIHVLEVSPFAQNCRILADSKTRHAVAVDPGGDVPLILALIERQALTLKEIWLTHSHLDHCGGVRRLKEATNATLVGHRLEWEFRARVTDVCALYGIPQGLMEACPEPEVYVEGGETLRCGDIEFSVLFTPGHSPGHVCYYSSALNVLLAGDTVFQGSIGRTDLPGGDARTLFVSIKRSILTLPGETRILSGHGPETTVERERRTNPFLQEGDAR